MTWLQHKRLNYKLFIVSGGLRYSNYTENQYGMIRKIDVAIERLEEYWMTDLKP